ncbi:MAG: hypothetical protein RLZZ450_3620 [Pseudomonadota bacterium]
MPDKRDAGPRSKPSDAGAADARSGSTPKPPPDSAGSTKDGGRDATAGLEGAPSADAGRTGARDASAADDDDDDDVAENGPTGNEGGDDACGPDAQLVTGTTRTQGSGDTNLQTSGNVEILSVRTTLKVPNKPSSARGTLFLWPGLQPLKSDSTIGYGVLQPVLTWGSSCAPGSLASYDQWWISGQYVGSPPGSFTNIKCEGGDVMKGEVGDELDIEMTLEGTVWNQVITNKSNGKSVSFKRDMKGQKQQWLINEIELTGATKPADDVIFTSMVVKVSESLPKACVPNVKGMTDYFSPPRASRDGKTCCISKLILRASGIKPSTPDTP